MAGPEDNALPELGPEGLVPELAEAKPELAVDAREEFRELFKSEKYRQRIAKMAREGTTSVVVDFEDIYARSPELARLLIEDPRSVLAHANEAAKEQLRIEEPDYAEKVREVTVRVNRLPELTPLRKLCSAHIGKLVSVEGIVVRATPVRPLVVNATYKCLRCGQLLITGVGKPMPTPPEPKTCPFCKSKGPFELDEGRTEFVDHQEIRIQEKPEDLPPGQLPRWVNVRIIGPDLVDMARPGDRVVITGIVRVATPRGAAARRGLEMFIEANNIEVATREAEAVEITPEEEKIIRELAKDPEIHRKIIQSIAPSIYGYEHIKEAIMYLLFGGVTKELPDVRKRGDIHVLLIGDPGTGKSALLQYVARIAPRGLYTSGRGTTAAGLTAAVIREPQGGMSLEAGALVLADKGVACIDEIEKMRPEDRVSIHEAMEQQSYHPSFEVLLADGRKARIGELVDGLMEARHCEVVKGVRCEILPLREPLEVLTLDLETFELRRVRVDRVSRHEAPDVFVRLVFSNGREVLVTPEHPVFVFSGGRVRTVPAAEVKPGDWVIGVRELPLDPEEDPPVGLATVRREHPLEKEVRLPEVLTPELARVLGYLISEGYSHVGSAHEMGFVNASEVLLADFRSLMASLFGLEPVEARQEGKAPVLRYVSSMLYRWLEANFPEVLRRADEKRAPAKIMAAPKSVVREFLRAAFLGDGGVEADAICFNTTSRGLAEDYQDLLLRLGITSRIFVETYRTKKGEEKHRYKVYITGDSLPRFFDEIVDPLDPRKERIAALVERSLSAMRQHDVLPTEVAKAIVELMGALGLPYDGYFNEHIKGGYGINRKVVERYLTKLSERLEGIRRALDERRPRSLRELRTILGWSQQRLADAIGVKRRTIDYAERGGYTPERREALLAEALEAVRRTLEGAEARMEELRKLLKLRFLRVKEAQIVPNNGPYRAEWVYDITVEPTHNFISHGLVLHNTISIAKGGIVATLNARTAILAAANPALGRYDPYRSVTENISLPITILSRFDLIFVVRDVPDKEHDALMATHILDTHRAKEAPVEPPIPPELLRKYISYAKMIEPKLTDEAIQRIRDFYLEMRSLSSGEGSPIAITARQLESLIRIAEARARAALRDYVTAEDAEAAINIMKRSLQEVGIDVETKRIDIDVIMTGKPKSLRDKLQIVLDAVARLDEGDGVSEVDLIRELEPEGLTEAEVRRLLGVLLRDGMIFEARPGRYKKV